MSFYLVRHAKSQDRHVCCQHVQEEKADVEQHPHCRCWPTSIECGTSRQTWTTIHSQWLRWRATLSGVQTRRQQISCTKVNSLVGILCNIYRDIYIYISPPSPWGQSPASHALTICLFVSNKGDMCRQLVRACTSQRWDIGSHDSIHSTNRIDNERLCSADLQPSMRCGCAAIHAVGRLRAWCADRLWASARLSSTNWRLSWPRQSCRCPPPR